MLATGALSLVGAGCATTGGSDDRIVEVASGRVLTRADLLAALRASDFALLGERHDNPHHHARRGELLAELHARVDHGDGGTRRSMPGLPEGPAADAVGVLGPL